MSFKPILWLLPCIVPMLLANSGCQQNGIDHDTAMQDTTTHAHTNRLVDETSPYLLQHAHNPVDWYPWGDEAFDKAKAENKIVLVSIGYSACHWCHVMEHESFEDDSVAKVMNDRFVCIKVDREERPDVDQVYMNAVQLMTGRGGWPLNCFTLPDGRPVYGGTYFPKDNWLELLENISTSFLTEPEKFEQYAQQLTQGVAQSELITLNTEPPNFTNDQLNSVVSKWSGNFDNSEGGPNRAPKFPIPNNYEFLLKHAQLAGDQQVMGHVRLTLDKMAMGGIYDQIGGGFARYSTDLFWKVPHFEKMLYDNAQLVSLYAQAWQATKDPLYEQTVRQTLEFVKRELTSDEGAFYSALDADSEGEEGKFYVWKKEEAQEVLGADFDLIAKYYNINSKGLWEHGNYILLRDKDDESFAKKNDLTVEELRNKVLSANMRLMERRDERIRPGLDDKSLVSWNALMVSGYCDAYAAFGEPSYLSTARTNMNLLLKKCSREDGGLYHSYKAGRTTINGYLEDYCFMIEALIDLYQVTFDENHLNSARELADYTIAHFHDESSGMFYFTSDIDPPLIARKTEVNDNVIPASNSSFSKGLFTLGHLFDHKPYIEMSEKMLNNVAQNMEGYPAGYSNWAQLMQYWTNPYYEIAITGKNALAKRQEFGQHFVPVGVLLGGVKDGKLPLLEGKFFDSTTIFVCENKTCQLPVEQVSEALTQMQ